MGPMVTEHQSYLASFLWMRVILNNEASAEWVLGTVQSVVSFSRSISSWNRSFGDHSFLLPSRRREGLQTSSDLDLYSSWLHWERNSWVHTQGEECRSHCWNGVWLQFYRQYLDHSIFDLYNVAVSYCKMSWGHQQNRWDLCQGCQKFSFGWDL